LLQQAVVETTALGVKNATSLGRCHNPARIPRVSACPGSVVAGGCCFAAGNERPDEPQPGAAGKPPPLGAYLDPIVPKQLSAGAGARDFGCHAGLARTWSSAEHNPSEWHQI
jgi:hypothetical protein